jgi:Serine/threonine protein kinase involved in cell cycle control
MEKDVDEIEARIARIKGERRVKDSRIFEVVEEVFDYQTLMALYKLLNAGVVKLVHGVVAAGKEARIYWAEAPDGSDIALKIYLVQLPSSGGGGWCTLKEILGSKGFVET